ncbi:6-bladed beta-propeller [Candidatus Aminicenantes bacterium AC-335-A11]|jgi:hypothetical protein|nr:6-bladed beta-propeller [SCandidatus Aminicenantes bacterium Aminicenantia_JdfR_composite]MCP2597464.1 6-bladed beta-propeller [Candidatus Aminicenantes bacterium AC-335-G13]MCP2598711.1 6-bladed beta-propeller [Candidatus Aminicenantes bacterium AC-335-L06]MCP2618976.1 6-bladed beta-propeller [Candidatus Aminicenantes bacterium AC-335-A11]
MRRKILLVLFLLIILSFNNGFGSKLTPESELKCKNLLWPIKLIVFNGNICILDKGDESVKIFDKKGKFLKRLGRKGEGPGEFSCIGDFFIYKGKAYILDTCKSKIEIFSVQHGVHLELKGINIPNPYKILVGNGKIYISSLVFLKGQKIITILVEERNSFQVINSFLDCIPIKNIDLENIYKNSGILTGGNGKVYFAFTLSNRVLEFSEDGKLLKEYSLPLKSIEKPVIDNKGLKILLKSALNYDIRMKGDKVYLLCRDKKKNSLIFELERGKFVEKFNIKENLISFDIAEDVMYGIEEGGDLLIYRLNNDRSY